MPGTRIDRRRLLGGIAAASAASVMPARLVFALPAATDKRFVFIIQRGAADGLSTLAPVGDPAFAGLRGELAADFAGVPRLDSTFALHPALSALGKLYQAKQALFLHAAASPYRDRSHFDGQNVLETGATAPYRLRDGWLNRTMGLLNGKPKAIAIAPTVPVALRGPIGALSYANSALREPRGDLLHRVSSLYAADPQLAALWSNALDAHEMASRNDNPANRAADLGTLAAAFLSAPDGARIAMIETDGWDTHADQRSGLAKRFAGLDGLIAGLRDGLGPAWDDTVVLVATEFGRTAAINGSGGTDHGTASVAMLLGGAVAGGRVVTDWPGLGPTQLYEARDLRPTLALDAAIAGAMGEHFGIEPARVLATAFPGSDGKPIEGLVRA